MSDAAVKPAVTHLHCDRCGDQPTVARIDGQTKLVCHCTHVDGPYTPVGIRATAILPLDWYWEENGGDGDE